MRRASREREGREGSLEKEGRQRERHTAAIRPHSLLYTTRKAASPTNGPSSQPAPPAATAVSASMKMGSTPETECRVAPRLS